MAALSDSESTLSLDGEPRRREEVPDDGKVYDIRRKLPHGKIFGPGGHVLGDQFDSRGCLWRPLGKHQVDRLRKGEQHVHLIGDGGMMSYPKYIIQEKREVGLATCFRVVHPKTGDQAIIRSLPSGNFIGNVYLDVDPDDSNWLVLRVEGMQGSTVMWKRIPVPPETFSFWELRYAIMRSLGCKLHTCGW